MPTKVVEHAGPSLGGVLNNTKESLGWHFRRRHWMTHDFILAALAVLFALWFDPNFIFAWSTPNPLVPGVYQAWFFYPLIVVLCIHVVGLQDPLGTRRRWVALAQTVLAVVAAIAVCLFARYAISLQQFGRTLVFRTFLFSVIFLWGSRVFLWRVSGATPKRIGCVLFGESLRRFVIQTLNHPLPVELVKAPVAGDIADEDVVEFLFRADVKEVVVAKSEDRRDLWLGCLNRGMQVTDVSAFVEREYYKIPCADIDLSWFLTINLRWNHPFYIRIKRLGDILASLIGLVLSAPLMGLGIVAVILESGRPVFYSQTRVGFGGRPYRLWKLRSMSVNAESGGPQWAQKSDPRVTRVGQILRRTRIDELPQFWNVLRGEMSIIGPRPERPEFVDKLSQRIPIYPQRHWIKPGITGWAQINYPYGASVEDAFEKLCYDLYYIKNASLMLDLHIALRTLGALMKGSR